MSTRTMLHPAVPSLNELLNLESPNVASKIHLERAVYPLSLLMKTLKPWNGSECVIGQLTVPYVAYELGIPTTTDYEVMSNHLDMKKVSTRWVPKLLTPIQRANRMDCCQELLQENEVNPDNYSDRIVTDDET